MLPRRNKMRWQQQEGAIVWLSADHTRTHAAGVCSSVIVYGKSFVSWESSTEKQRGILWRDGGVRGLCLPTTAVTPWWGSWACPLVHLGGCGVGGQKNGKPSESQEDIIRHRVCARTWLQLGRKQAAADRVGQGGRTDRCRKLLPENVCLLSAIHTKWSCCITSPLRWQRFLLFTWIKCFLPPGTDLNNEVQ